MATMLSQTLHALTNYTESRIKLSTEKDSVESDSLQS